MPLPPVAPPAAPKPPVLDHEAFLSVFLASEDLPTGMQQLHAAEEFRFRLERLPPTLRDVLVDLASAEWSDPHGDEPLQRLREMHALFATEEQARLSERAAVEMFLRGRFEEAGGALALGGDARVFALRDQRKSSTPILAYAFVFRVGRVLMSVTVTSGPRVREGALTMEMASAIAQRAAARAARAQGNREPL